MLALADPADPEARAFRVATLPKVYHVNLVVRLRRTVGEEVRGLGSTIKQGLTDQVERQKNGIADRLSVVAERVGQTAVPGQHEAAHAPAYAREMFAQRPHLVWRAGEAVDAQ